MILTVADIMTTRLVKLTPSATLQDAHNITREKGIRHLPVVDQKTGKLLALVTQKTLIARVISNIALYGGKELADIERKTNIMEIAVTDFSTVKKTEPLADIGPYFIKNKHGCMPVVDDNNGLLGIITSSDFVKLSVTLLNQLENKR